MKEIINLIISHEGFRSKVYKCPAGKLTIGYGRNLEDKGISDSEAMFLLMNDVLSTERDISMMLPFFENLSYPRQCVLIDMGYNLGLQGLMEFKKMLEALHDGDYDKASKEMLDSKWAKQVGNRAIELSDIIKTSKFTEK